MNLLSASDVFLGTTPMKLLGLMIIDKDKPITEIVGR
jgi:hypothetical protein